jgi:hypothetical protein
VARQHLKTDAPRAEVVNDVDEVAQARPNRSSFQTMEWKNSAQVLVIASADPNLHSNCEAGRPNAASIPSVSVS